MCSEVTTKLPGIIIIASTLFFISIFTGCNCQCTGTPITWEAIPEDQYDRNESSIIDTQKRPLGFYYTVIPYTPDGDPNPCFKVDGTNGKRVEIMVETYGALNSKICVRTESNEFGCEDAGKFYNCEQANANSLTVELYCDANGCEQSPVGVWVRFVVSFDEFDDDPEMFCFERDTNQFPSSLVKVPPRTVPPIYVTTSKSGRVSPITVTLLLLTCCISILFQLIKL